MFATLLEERRRSAGTEQPVVTDLCCSYGINAALMNHDLDIDDLYERYCDPVVDAYTSEELARADLRYFEAHRKDTPAQVVGIDVAPNAVSYGVASGLLDEGASENLEQMPPSPGLSRAVADTDIVTVTGGVGYVSEQTFSRLLEAVDTEPKPWVAAFALRWVDFEPVADALAGAGLVTEHVEGAEVRQRRFADGAEREYVLDELRDRGIDPSGLEESGWYFANLFVSRPWSEVRKRPAAALLKEAV
ncbi:MAG TPA: hypothetical protein VF152_15165 [Acidimicrobiia bacterium]